MRNQLQKASRQTPNRKISRRSIIRLGTSIGAALAINPSMVSGQSNRDSDDLTSISATRLAALIRSRKVSVVEVVDAHLERIETVNGKLNALVQYDKEEVRTLAKEADARLDVSKPRPLHGVPVTIKDVFDVVGYRTTAGLPSKNDGIADRDATVVQKLKAAGAIILGKTNVPPFSTHFETDNPVFGRTNNPHDLERTPGGSSGGEAAIIAAGGSPIGLGVDGGGSIRVPAHFCGIAGLRASWGRVSLAGGFPPIAAREYGTYVAAGPLARHVEDLHLMLSVVSGEDPNDPYTFPVALRNPDEIDFKRLRFAVWMGEGLPETPEPTSETVAAIDRAAESLVDAGATRVTQLPPAVENLYHIFDYRWSPRRALANLPPTLAGSRIYEESMAYFRRHRDRTSEAVEKMARQKWLPKLQTEWLRFLDEVDVVVCPVNSEPAMRHLSTWKNIRAFNFTLATSLLPKVPAGSVRCGQSESALPIGVQILSKPFRDDIVLATMSRLETELGGWKTPYR